MMRADIGRPRRVDAPRWSQSPAAGDLGGPRRSVATC